MNQGSRPVLRAAIGALGAIVALTTGPALATGLSPLNRITIEGLIDFVDPTVTSNFLGIEVGDPFSIEAIYNRTLLANIGRETLTPEATATSIGDPSLSFELRIDRGPAVVWDERDDLIYPFGPLINFDDGDFDSFVFQSNDFFFASDAFVQVVDDVEIRDSGTPYDTLATGSFRRVSVSPN